MRENLTSSEEIGKRLKVLRIDRTLEPNETAKFINITREQLTKYERGLTEQPLNIVARLAVLYGVSLEYIASGKGPIKNV